MININRSLVLVFNVLLWFGWDFFLVCVCGGGVVMLCYFFSFSYKIWDLGFFINSIFGCILYIFCNVLFIEIVCYIGVLYFIDNFGNFNLNFFRVE